MSARAHFEYATFKDNRHPIDDFVIQCCSELTRRDFSEIRRLFGKAKQQKRASNNFKMHHRVEAHVGIQSKVMVRMGTGQEIETLIDEEARTFATLSIEKKLLWQSRFD